MNEVLQGKPAGLFRRLAASVYDLLLLAGLLMLCGLVVVGLRAGKPVPPGTLWFQLLLLAVTGTFYAGFWSHGGQTLGMRSWRLRVERCDGRPLSAADAARRFAAALVSLLPAGLGFWWMLFDREQRTWYDRLSDTRVVLEPKQAARR